MSDASFLYIVSPIIIPFFIIYTYNIKPIEHWASNKSLYGFLWTAFYISLGFLLYKSDESDDIELFWCIFSLLIVSYMFIIYTKFNIKYSLALLFLMMGLTFATFIELLFARLIDDDNIDSLERGYVHLIIPSIVLVFYLLFCMTSIKQ